MNDIPEKEDHSHDMAHAHGTLRSYATGFGLSVILTFIPFWLVMTGELGSAAATGYFIMALAATQIIVHVFYFLHLDVKSEAGWTIMALIFTVVMVVIVISGSVWIMYHLNTNMMSMPGDTSQIP